MTMRNQNRTAFVVKIRLKLLELKCVKCFLREYEATEIFNLHGNEIRNKKHTSSTVNDTSGAYEKYNENFVNPVTAIGSFDSTVSYKEDENQTLRSNYSNNEVNSRDVLFKPPLAVYTEYQKKSFNAKIEHDAKRNKKQNITANDPHKNSSSATISKAPTNDILDAANDITEKEKLFKTLVLLRRLDELKKKWWKDWCSHKQSLIFSDDVVQCVPTKKGHQILFKGYTYVFKSRLQCGSEQWCCSFRQKTEQPEWVLIYFLKNSETEFRCNICELVINAEEKSPDLLEHIKLNHKEVYDLHRDNPFSSVGFRIEFLQVMKSDGSDPMNREVIIGEVCEAGNEEIAKPITGVTDSSDVLSEIDSHIVVTRNDSNIIVTKKKKAIKSISLENRKRSWVWKYFEKVSNIMYRCRFCNAILSIKGCNTNNLNRHMRTKHTKTFQLEMEGKKDEDITIDMDSCKQEILDKDLTETYMASDTIASESPGKLRSWVWTYFSRISGTLAQCKLCKRNICHGGNATGNMNRHLKMRHNKTGESSDHTWIWKVFDVNEEDFYTCKICQYQCLKMDDLDMSINTILNHLRLEHGVISGDQIITPAGCK